MAEESKEKAELEGSTKKSLLKYQPERDYESRNYKSFGGPWPDLCKSCKHFYARIHDNGLTKKEFPPSCNGHIVETTQFLDQEDFETEDDYVEALLTLDPVAWAYDMFPDDQGAGWAARWYQEEIMSCQNGSTEVYMADGSIKKIKDISVGDQVLTYDETGRRTFSKPVLRHLENGVKDVYRITLENGDKLECTSDHEIYSWSKCGTINQLHGCPSYKSSYRSIDEGLAVGDRVFVLNRFSRYGDIDSASLAKLLGYIVTDGYIKDNVVSFANIRKEYVVEFKELVSELFSDARFNDRYTPAYTDRHGVSRQDTWWVTVRSKELTSFLNEIGVCDRTNRELGILEYAFRFTEDALRAFINRSWAGDGCVYTHGSGVAELSFHSGNKEFLDKYRYLLRKIGIINSKVYEKPDSNAIKLVIVTVDDILRFFDEVGPIYGKETETQECLDATDSRIRRTRRRFKTTSRQKIVSIEYICKEAVYDIEVKDRHNFFANGSVVHNCTSYKKVVRAGRRCLKEGTMVATPTGPKPIERFKPGDEVYDENGKIIKVLNVYDQGEQDVVNLVNHNRTYASATLDHRWLTHYEGRQTEKIRISSELTKRHRIVRTEVESPLGTVHEKYAYVLGAMLGDGVCREIGFCISSDDEPIVAHIASILDIDMPKRSKSSYTWYMPAKCKSIVPHYKNWLHNRYTHEKTVDMDILCSWNRDSLLSFMAGLIDTDGSVFSAGDKELVVYIGMQAIDVVRAAQYAFLALWQIDIPIRTDDREKYVNGPVFELRIKHTYHCRRILRELSPYLQTERKKYKPEYDEYNANNFNPRSLGVQQGEVYTAPTWDLEVDSPTSLYLLANGLVTHNTGKTESICVMMLWMTHVNSDFSVLVIAPFEAQVNLIWDKLQSFINKSPKIQSTIKRNSKSSEHVLEFNNGSKITGFSSSSSSSARSDKVRGQDAKYIVLDEADYLASDDIEAILAILASHPDCGMWASSTPTGRHDKFYQFCVQKDLGFKEFHYTSAESPSWTDETEQFFRTSYALSVFEHEFYAIFGIQESGVFRNDLVDLAIVDYQIPKERIGVNSRVVIGVDWNGQSIGTHIVVVEAINSDKGLKYVLLYKTAIKGVEFTQHESVQKIIDLDKRYNADFIYVDQGFGLTQIEMLQKYGMSTPGNFHKKVKAYAMGGGVKIIDPLTKQEVKKDAKPFMVHTTVNALERGLLYLPSSEDTQVLVDSIDDEESGSGSGIVQQMRNFSVERITPTGRETYSQGDEHALTAYMLAITGLTLEFSDMRRRNIPTDVLHLKQKKDDGKKEEGGTQMGPNVEVAAIVRQLELGFNRAPDIAGKLTLGQLREESVRRGIAKNDPRTMRQYFRHSSRGLGERPGVREERGRGI
jgi:intein/homing endonuclease